MIVIPIVVFLNAGLPFLFGLAVGRWWAAAAAGMAAGLLVVSDTDDWLRVASLYAAWYATCASGGVGLRRANRARRQKQVRPAP